MSVIVIPGANFASNAIEQININKINPSYYCIPFENRAIRYLNMTNYNATLSCFYKYSSVGKENLFIYDVSTLIGKQLSMKAVSLVVDDAKFNCFASNADISAIQNYFIYVESNTDKIGNVLRDKITSIENFNISVTSDVINTITKTVPNGARYLFITNRPDTLEIPEVSLIV